MSASANIPDGVPPSPSCSQRPVDARSGCGSPAFENSSWRVFGSNVAYSVRQAVARRYFGRTISRLFNSVSTEAAATPDL